MKTCKTCQSRYDESNQSDFCCWECLGKDPKIQAETEEALKIYQPTTNEPKRNDNMEWIINPDGCGAQCLTTNQRTSILCECHKCKVMGYDHDAHSDEEVEQLFDEPTVLAHVSANEYGEPICDECWDEVIAETEEIEAGDLKDSISGKARAEPSSDLEEKIKEINSVFRAENRIAFKAVRDDLLKAVNEIDRKEAKTR